MTKSVRDAATVLLRCAADLSIQGVDAPWQEAFHASGHYYDAVDDAAIAAWRYAYNRLGVRNWPWCALEAAALLEDGWTP